MSPQSLLQRIWRNKSGVAMTEFALGAPFLLMAGLWGAETANYALVNMKVGQLATHIADNGSRIGDTSTLENRRIYESDLNDVLLGAQIQSGALDLYDQGRVIISSLEVDDATGDQYIHWQRCRGDKHVSSKYGDQGDVVAAGMGPPGEEVYAPEGDAVIFVEIYYTYKPLVSERFMGSLEMSSMASFSVRDSRDLSQVYQRSASDPDPVQRCTVYSGEITVAKNGVIN